MISGLEKLLGTPRDGALLRYSLGLEYRRPASPRRRSSTCARPCARDPLYSAAWKALGQVLSELDRRRRRLAAYRQGIEAAEQEGRPPGARRK